MILLLALIVAANDSLFWSIPLASLVISAFGLIYAARGLRKSADLDHVQRLESQLSDARTQIDQLGRRIQACEDDREKLKDDLAAMGRRELELMRAVFGRTTEGPARDA